MPLEGYTILIFKGDDHNETLKGRKAVINPLMQNLGIKIEEVKLYNFVNKEEAKLLNSQKKIEEHFQKI